ncbi:hypothetical protein DL89DRAFT_267490 [Linderina pennispora]|uniref:Uncharacterized protein n=1 Tax=Linderina pennispora TaxID=61395 RepID=A0A1Y1WAT8_9FUNG|nr:uncharacterized protein DL89DRAFT_267490 [Linderina pennispora]ORX70274.1 hypothetical protein DL89DRAFT_267490 [Linderina pennispora]
MAISLSFGLLYEVGKAAFILVSFISALSATIKLTDCEYGCVRKDWKEGHGDLEETIIPSQDQYTNEQIAKIAAVLLKEMG